MRIVTRDNPRIKSDLGLICVSRRGQRCAFSFDFGDLDALRGVVLRWAFDENLDFDLLGAATVMHCARRMAEKGRAL